MLDVLIIGGGIIGTSVARELSKYNLNIILIEKEIELSMGASKANSGIIHGGFDSEIFSLKAKTNVEGNKLYKNLVKELEIPFKKNGSLVLALNKKEEDKIYNLFENGKKNNVPDLEILKKEEILKLEPNLNENMTLALHSKSGGIISPYEAVQAFGENAFLNGVKFNFEEEIINIKKENNYYLVETNKNIYKTKIVVNSAGIYSDVINNFVSEKKYTITPRKGEYMLFDKSTKGYIEKTIFQVPGDFGKGVLVTPTVHGNLMVGPSSEFISNKEDTTTNSETLKEIGEKSLRSIKKLPMNKLITSFTGLRANLLNHEDFIVEEAENNKGFINAIGINSPGLTAAPSIALLIRDLISNRLDLKEKENFNPKRERIIFIRNLNKEEQNNLIKKNNSYGKIVCRCETVTEGEIINSIRRNLGAKTMDGVKRLTRAGMGRCQGGFCGSKVAEILARELNINIDKVTKFGRGSYIILKK